ncbi:MAG: hypothetical protein J7M27_11895 [Candidatus Latescibacteria bacterium]|nr:hypothetical protein [Candidatus Latescibacterota bacterium]
MSDAAEDLGILAAHLDAIRKKYGIEISSARDSSLAKSGASHAQRSIPNKEQSFGQPQILGLIGAVLAFVGAFCPIVSAPILGSLNYF